jgi:DNA-binding NtrC family response regulator
MTSGPSILVVDDEPNSLFGISQVLTDEGYKVIAADNGKEALERLKTDTINLIITDERMSGFSGMELLTEAQKLDPQIPVIMVTAYGSVSLAVDALKQGAFYFFEKPIFNNLERFLTIIHQALKTKAMERELDHLRKEVGEKYSYPNIIKAFAMVKLAAARANFDCGQFGKEILTGIRGRCRELIDGKLHDQFRLDVLQGGAGIEHIPVAFFVGARRAVAETGFV